MTAAMSRDVPVERGQAALLFIDVQNFCAIRQGTEYKQLSPAEFESKVGWYFRELEGRVVPNMQRLQAACRQAGIEVMYAVIESLTKDGRDRSLDYKITGFNVPRGSWDAKVIDAIKPGEDEIVTELCLAALGRPPGEKERRAARKLFAAAPPREAAQDFLWALLNSNEFLFAY